MGRFFSTHFATAVPKRKEPLKTNYEQVIRDLLHVSRFMQFLGDSLAPALLKNFPNCIYSHSNSSLIYFRSNILHTTTKYIEQKRIHKTLIGVLI